MKAEAKVHIPPPQPPKHIEVTLTGTVEEIDALFHICLLNVSVPQLVAKTYVVHSPHITVERVENVLNTMRVPLEAAIKEARNG